MLLHHALGCCIAGLSFSNLVFADDFKKWCGKPYQYGAPIPDTLTHTFPYPGVSETPLLDFQCATKSSFYLTDDAVYDPPMIIIDANITNDIGSPCEILRYASVLMPDYESTSNLTVTVSLNGSVLATGSVTPGSMGNLLHLSLDNLTSSSGLYSLTCTAQGGGQTYTSYAGLSYRAPPPWGGCGAKVDRLSGTTMVRNSTAGEVQWKKIYPVGFYDVSNPIP